MDAGHWAGAKACYMTRDVQQAARMLCAHNPTPLGDDPQSWSIEHGSGVQLAAAAIQDRCRTNALGPDLFQEAARAGAMHGRGVEERADVGRRRSSGAQHAAAPGSFCVPCQELQHQLWGNAFVRGLQQSHMLSFMASHPPQLLASGGYHSCKRAHQYAANKCLIKPQGKSKQSASVLKRTGQLLQSRVER